MDNRTIRLSDAIEAVGQLHPSGFGDGDGAYSDALEGAIEALSALPDVGGWLDIESAPKDGSEILGYRPDSGAMLIRWSCAAQFLTDAELDKWDEEAAFQEDWFYADFVAGDRLEGDCLPTHWQPLPAPPEIGG